MEIIICDSDNVNAGKIKDICFQYSFQWEEESEIKIINARGEMYSYMKASNLTSLIIAETAIVKGEMISEKLKEQFVLVMGHTPEAVSYTHLSTLIINHYSTLLLVAEELYI